MKCAVCDSSIAFGRSASVCKFCGRTVHPHCEAAAPKDCGLSSDLASILKSSAASAKEVLHRGYLKIPDHSRSRKTWRTVAVQLLSSNRLLAEDPESGKKRMDLDLGCSKSSDGAGGSVFTHGTVAYTELAHSAAFAQPQHVFKICRTKGAKTRETHYFMAKSESEKQSWIDAVERVVQGRYYMLSRDSLNGDLIFQSQR